MNRLPGIIEGGGNLSAVGFGFDLGVRFQPASWCALGVTIRDLRSRYTWDTQELWERGTQTVDRFPVILRVGGMVTAWSERLIVAVDMEKVEHMPPSLYLGTQFGLARTLFLRGGIRRGGLTLGLGSRIFWKDNQIQVDYGFVPDPVAPGGNHVFTWSFMF
jgi:hypothetical protein